MVYQMVGMWALRRAYRLLTADDPRPLQQRLGREARRILLGAALTLGLLILGVIVLVVVLIAAAT
jgi:4-amino-4-deoxy-L-arabinose transferase-like glycosyltransferase